MSPRLLRPRATGFNPKSIAGLAVWLDAGAPASLTFNGSTISQINDQSGNARNGTQATAARQPSYSATDANGRPAITFPSGGLSVVTPEWAFTNTVTVFAVAKNTNNSFGGMFQRGAVNERHAGFRNSGTLVARRGGSSDASVTFTSSDYNVMQWSFAATLGRTTVNGTAGTDQTSSVSFAADIKSLRVGSLGDGTLGMIGGIAEFLYYDALISTTEAAAVRRYLGRKYNIGTT
jgi:hypothetical protein